MNERLHILLMKLSVAKNSLISSKVYCSTTRRSRSEILKRLTHFYFNYHSFLSLKEFSGIKSKLFIVIFHLNISILDFNG